MEPSPASALVQEAPIYLTADHVGDCSPNWVHIFHRKGQPVENWMIRITGTDLTKLTGTVRGRANVSVTDADGVESFQKWFDRHNPLNTYVYLSGAQARISVNIVADPKNGRSCSSVFTIDH